MKFVRFLLSSLLLAAVANAQAPANHFLSAAPAQASATPAPAYGGQTQPLPNPPNPDYSGSAPTIAQQLVPLDDEPHHHLLLQNFYVRVYAVSVPPLDATLMYKHELPFVAVNLGATDVVNQVQGKPEARLTLQDGQVTYSSGGFSQLIRTDAGLPFRNVTVVLAKPQGTARNLCKPIVAGPLECPPPPGTTKKSAAESADDDAPYFETDEIRVDVIKVADMKNYVEEKPKYDALLVALSNANLNANLGGEHVSFLHGGDILWLPAGIPRRVTDFLDATSNFLLVSFKDTAPATGQQ
jgi:hypothetical protein